MIFTIFGQYQEAYAVLPLVALTPAAVEALAGVLYAAGLTYATANAIDGSVKFWYSEAGTESRQAMLSAASSVVNGVMQVSDTLWTNATSWLHTKFASGTNTIQANYAYEQNYPISIEGQTIKNLGQSITIGSDTYWLQRTAYAYNQSGVAVSATYQLYKNGLASGSTFSHDFANWVNREPYFAIFLSSSNGLYLRYYYKQSYYSLETVGNVSSLYASGTYPMPAPASITYSTAPIYNDTAYDYKTAEGRRDVKVLQGLDSYVGKTYTDIQNPTAAAEPTPIPGGGGTIELPSYTGSWTGAFKDCVPDMGDYKFTGSGTITGVMDNSRTGTWAGTWGWTVTGERVWTGTYTDAQSLTWTGTSTEVKVTSISATDTLNFEPLKVAGTLFTNKFPFSLPWDLKRSFSTLAAENGNPNFRFTFNTKLLGYQDIQINMSMWSSIISVSKVFELLAFDIGLIFLTRKLLGGAS
jgi:hypothetical protein